MTQLSPELRPVPGLADGFDDPDPSPTARTAMRLASRAVALVVTLLGLMALTFAMGRLLPNDPVIAVTGPEVSKEVYDRVFRELGLDRPVWEQFLTYAGNVLHGDLGVSTTTGQKVLTDLLSVYPATIELAVVALIVGIGLGVPLGVVAAVKHGTITDHIARLIGLAGSSIPSFWMALMALLLFYAKLDWVAASGRVDVFYEGLVPPVTGFLMPDAIIAGDWDVFWNALNHIVLPGTILGYYSVAYISRMTRSFMLEQLSQEYVVTALAKGLTPWQITWRHAFKNIRVQLLTIIALTFGGLLDGAVLIETVFAWPGLGQYLTRGIQMNDINVVMGSVLMIGVVFLIVNMVTDVLYRVLDPRTR